jgi:two-component system phosphate regulon sensor histidine kinase PhoR
LEETLKIINTKLSIIARFEVGVLKLGRNLSAVVTVIVACSLLTAGLAEWQGSGIGIAHPNWNSIMYIGLYCVGVVGVICLSWYWLKLAKAITSIADQLKTERFVNFKPKSNTVIGDLTSVINARLQTYDILVQQLQKQVQDLQIQTQLSQRQRRNTEAIIYSLRDAVVVIDEFDRLLMANEPAGKLFEFDLDQAQQRPIAELMDADRSDFVDFLRQCRQSKVEATRRQIEFSKDTRLRTFDCIVSCVHDSKEQVSAVVAVLHDITREKEVSQMKDDFVSHVSHELKTPLASITAYSEMLVDGEADDEQTRKEFYAVIQSQAQRLNRLIEDILNISRIESGLIKVSKEPVNLAILIEEQLQMIRSYAEEKNITVHARKPIVYDQVYADKDMISQVVVNLLSNAVKYTPSGGSVKIEIDVDDVASLARVSVTDTGVGIPEDELEHVFDKFYRVGANKAQAKGTGLGLNLVKQIIETVHNGHVFVKSQVGLGSTFGFEIPLATERKLTHV